MGGMGVEEGGGGNALGEKGGRCVFFGEEGRGRRWGGWVCEWGVFFWGMVGGIVSTGYSLAL